MQLDFSYKSLSKFNIIILIRYLLDAGCKFNDILFAPSIFSGVESRTVHSVEISKGYIIIYVNDFFLPASLYSKIIDSDSDSDSDSDLYENLLVTLIKIESTLLRHKYKMIFIEELGIVEQNTSLILSSHEDLFPGSPLCLINSLATQLSEFGDIFPQINFKTIASNISNNILNNNSKLGNISIGSQAQKSLKVITLKIILNDDYTGMDYNNVKNIIKFTIKQNLPEEPIVEIILDRHPDTPFVLNKNTLGLARIYNSNFNIQVS
ncbi:hypothetical protein OAO18_06405 [Francisellaceae bacterium]|nr:hypothetical protein [Francisellaceae bacterium]